MRRSITALLIVAAALAAGCAQKKAEPAAISSSQRAPDPAAVSSVQESLEPAAVSPAAERAEPGETNWTSFPAPLPARGKSNAGLALRLEAPEKMISRSGPLSLKLDISGSPGSRLDVRFLAGEGVSLPEGGEGPVAVQLDEDGRAGLKIPVHLDAARGGILVAQIATGDGRMQEVCWVHRGDATRRKVDVGVMEDGRGVRLSPSS
ncbi:MAG: hypothetical protein JXA90_10625 [Planctomycetes bacterium]|nr:hypothetical protein [Planctomycetota bacterium]